MASIYRSGHVTTAYMDHVTGRNGLIYHGGNGKISPEIFSATTKRLFSPVNATKATDSTDTVLEYSYDHPVVDAGDAKMPFGGSLYPYSPLPREHSLAHPITTPQLPLFLHNYIQEALQEHYSDVGVEGVKGLDSLFTVMYGGRQSPTVILGDLWLHFRLKDLWIQVLDQSTPVSIAMAQDVDIDSYLVEKSRLKSQSFVFSLPSPPPNTTTNPNSSTSTQPNTNTNSSKTTIYNHYLVTRPDEAVEFTVYQIGFVATLTKPQSIKDEVSNTTAFINPQLIKDEVPVISIIKKLDLIQTLALLPRTAQQAIGEQSQQSTLAPFVATQFLAHCVDFVKIDENMTHSSTQLTETSQTNKTTTPHKLCQTFPLPRYKAASTSNGSIMYIHGGRSGFSMNYVNKMVQIFSYEDFIQPEVLQDEAVMIESILPLTPPKTTLNETAGEKDGNNVGQDDGESTPQSPSQTEAPSQAENAQSEATLESQIDPTFASLILNDLWSIDLSVYPFRWTRLDTIYSQNNQPLPSHRFGHAAAFITVPDEQNVERDENGKGNENDQNDPKPSKPTNFLLLHGGLRLNHDCADNAQGFTNYNNNNNDNTSSYHKALISSPTLFFLALPSIKKNTSLLSQATSPSNNNQSAAVLDPSSYTSYHFTPSLVLDRPHHTDVSDQLILPPSIQIGQRPFDLYGHQLVAVPITSGQNNRKNENAKNSKNTKNCSIIAQKNAKIVLLAIGGTSHTCLAAASVMALEINLETLSQQINRFNDEISTNPSTFSSLPPFFWTPIGTPIADALFIRHTATVLSASQGNDDVDCKIQIGVLGGGALCFSFGTYYSPSLLLDVTYHAHQSSNDHKSNDDDENQSSNDNAIDQLLPYSHFTQLSMNVNAMQLTCLTPADQEQQNAFQNLFINNRNTIINTPKQLNKQKQTQQLRQKMLLKSDPTVVTIKDTKAIKGVSQICVVCGLEFESKNKLFKHITITGHKKVEELTETVDQKDDLQ